MTSIQMKRNLTTACLYAIGFFMLWEWMRPLKELTDLGNVTYFLVFLILSFMLDFFSIKFRFQLLIKGLYILYAMNVLYYEESFFNFAWVIHFGQEAVGNFNYIWAREWTSLTDPFRSLLFFILIWLMAYLITYWLVVQKRIFLFLFMTIMYLTVLDTFTNYAADGAIVRTIILGFIVLSVLNFQRLLHASPIEANRFAMKKWTKFLLVMLVISVVVGFAGPKPDPIWPDPVPFIKSLNEKSGPGNDGVKKLGYGEDDSKLGGAFIGDNQVVFTAISQSKHYWKVETKDYYTGKGWISRDSAENPRKFNVNDPVPLEQFYSDVKTKQETDQVNMKITYPHIVYPLGIQSVRSDTNVGFEVQPKTEKIRTYSSGYLKTYQITYNVPEYSVAQLQKVNSLSIRELNLDFRLRYTYLPQKIPVRIRQLAEEITKGTDNVFDQAKKIEAYFNRPEFSYDQKNVAIPKENQDYVDQFLFETKRGYCDNFSSSMVVMLRSLGIPSRWVKGYTEGEWIGSTDGNADEYQITNNNAHSWVEVYFPDVGWVSFEPTKGYTNNAQFQYGNDQADAVTPETPKQEQKQQTPKTEQKKPNQQDPDKQETKVTKSSSQGANFFKQYWKRIVVSFLGMVLIGVVIYRRRSYWLPRYYIWRFKRSSDHADFAKAYMILLKQLARNGIKRKPNQTLREYAKYIDQYFQTTEMTRLTLMYEQLVYKGEQNIDHWNDAKKLWENLIKRMTA